MNILRLTTGRCKSLQTACYSATVARHLRITTRQFDHNTFGTRGSTLHKYPVNVSSISNQTSIRKGWFWIFGIAGAAFGLYSYILYQSFTQVGEKHESTCVLDVSDRYDIIAADYDQDIEWSEKLMGLKRLRRRLGKQANGHVLEVSCGTGRNMEFYGQGIRRGRIASITFVDQSEQMLQIAERKFRQQFPTFRCAAFRAQKAEKMIKASGFEGFDTIIETFGLCSVEDPAKYLKSIASLAKRNGGRVVLIEHGRSYYAWLNRIIDNGANEHAHRFGCWWNRDIEQIVTASGLTIIQQRRRHFGTTWWLELKHPE